jgi:VanZ family protein
MLESTVWFGADRTSQPLRRIWEAIFGHVSNRSWHLIHTCIRKSGHFLGFGLVGLAWLRAWWMSIPNSRFVTDAWLALAGTALVASGDELHQTFLPVRCGTS